MKDEKLSRRASTLSQLILLSRDLYHSRSCDDQKTYLETVAGAAIWYLPSGGELYSGMISKAALAALQKDPGVKLVEEHSFPRKVAGSLLYNIVNSEELDAEGIYLERMYREKFGRYNLVLGSENNKLKRFQRKNVFIDEETAYALADIELVPLSLEDYKAIRKQKAVKTLKKITPKPF